MANEVRRINQAKQINVSEQLTPGKTTKKKGKKKKRNVTYLIKI